MRFSELFRFGDPINPYIDRSLNVYMLIADAVLLVHCCVQPTNLWVVIKFYRGNISWFAGKNWKKKSRGGSVLNGY